MPVKRRIPKDRIPQPLTLADLLPVELAFLRGEPEPPDSPYGHWWSLYRDEDLFRPGRPSIAEMEVVIGHRSRRRGQK